MNTFLWAAAILLLGMIPCGIVLLRDRIMERLVALQMIQVLTVQVMLLLAEGFGRDIYIDLALVLAVLTFAGSLAYARFLERWL